MSDNEPDKTPTTTLVETKIVILERIRFFTKYAELWIWGPGERDPARLPEYSDRFPLEDVASRLTWDSYEALDVANKGWPGVVLAIDTWESKYGTYYRANRILGRIEISEMDPNAED